MMRVFVAGAAVFGLASMVIYGMGCSAFVGQQSTALADSHWVTDAGQTLEFKGVDVIQGFSGCNSYFGDAAVGEARVALKPTGSSAMYCLDPRSDTSEGSCIMTTEKRFLTALKSARLWRIEQNRLVLLDAQSVELLTFKPRS